LGFRQSLPSWMLEFSMIIIDFSRAWK
jgi:hypothetical protein